MTAKRLRIIALLAISTVFLLAWAFPIVWSVMNSLKTDSDVLAYPPKLVFTPTWEAYRDVLFGSGSILPNLLSSVIISVGTTIVTMLMAVPAAPAPRPRSSICMPTGNPLPNCRSATVPRSRSRC